jgi:hypothetical protein
MKTFGKKSYEFLPLKIDKLFNFIVKVLARAGPGGKHQTEISEAFYEKPTTNELTSSSRHFNFFIAYTSTSETLPPVIKTAKTSVRSGLMKRSAFGWEILLS